MELRFLKKPEMANPRMLVGLPGMGLVARTTINYFMESLKPELLAEKIVDAAKLCGVDIIYTVIATHVQRYVEEPEVYGVATSPELLQFLESKGVKITGGSLQISGVNGLVIEYALRKGLKNLMKVLRSI